MIQAVDCFTSMVSTRQRRSGPGASMSLFSSPMSGPPPSTAPAAERRFGRPAGRRPSGSGSRPSRRRCRGRRGADDITFRLVRGFSGRSGRRCRRGWRLSGGLEGRTSSSAEETAKATDFIGYRNVWHLYSISSNHVDPFMNPRRRYSWKAPVGSPAPGTRWGSGGLLQVASSPPRSFRPCTGPAQVRVDHGGFRAQVGLRQVIEAPCCRPSCRGAPSVSTNAVPPRRAGILPG